MKVKDIIYLALLLVPLFSCGKEPDKPDPVVPNPKELTTTVHYCVTVSQSAGTRASLNGSSGYIFEAGDKLYVSCTHTDNNVVMYDVYGILSLVSGGGNTSASFEGDLICADNFTLEDNTSLSATLVGAQDKIHIVSSGKVTGTAYPRSGESPFADSFEDAVRFFGDFTATAFFSDHAFTLNQQSAFLLFSIVLPEDYSTQNPDATVCTGNGEGDITLQSAITYTTVDGDKQADFVAAFPSGTQLKESAYVKIGNEANLQLSPYTLAANNYYTVSRSYVPFTGFTVEAINDGTEVTFNFATAASDGIQFKKEDDLIWTDYLTTDGAITLDEGEKVFFRGKRNSYKINNNNTRLLTVNDDENDPHPCYVYGDIMSLVCNDNYKPKNTLGATAFRDVFNGATWLRIKQNERLSLSATTIGNDCYRAMFSGCTNIAYCPVTSLPAETLADRCYYEMFYGCTSMTDAPSIITHGTDQNGGAELKPSCFYRMFRGCSSLESPISIGTITTVNANSCQEMFYSCSSLTMVTGSLNASDLANNCYQSMFNGCSKLVSAPSLSVSTTVATSSCASMFKSCAKLSSVTIDLSAPVLLQNCYKEMFYGCKLLTAIKCLATTDIATNDSTTDWVKNISSSGTFTYADGVSWPSGNNGIPANWTTVPLP